MTSFDCTADLVGQLNWNGQNGMLQIDAHPVENFWLRHCLSLTMIQRYQIYRIFNRFAANQLIYRYMLTA